MNTCTHTKTGTQMFIAALFVVAKTETTVVSTTGEWMVRLSAVHKHEQTTDTSSRMGESQKHSAKQRKPDTEKYVLCDSTYIKI